GFLFGAILVSNEYTITNYTLSELVKFKDSKILFELSIFSSSVLLMIYLLHIQKRYNYNLGTKLILVSMIAGILVGIFPVNTSPLMHSIVAWIYFTIYPIGIFLFG